MPHPPGPSLYSLLNITILWLWGAQAKSCYFTVSFLSLWPGFRPWSHPGVSPFLRLGGRNGANGWPVAPIDTAWSASGSVPRLILVESVPEDLPFAAGSPTAQPLAQAWLQLLDTAQESVHIASYYWSLTGLDIGVNDSSSRQVGPCFCFLTMGHQSLPGCQGLRKSGCYLFRAQLGSALGWGWVRANPGSLGGSWDRDRETEDSVCMASFIWLLVMSQNLGYPGLWAKGQPAAVFHGSLALQGEALLQKLQQLLLRNVSVEVATHSPTLAKTSTDLQVLAAHGGCLHAGALLCCGLLCTRG